jgi:pimeloyl-ACP methyl ester carboxylesterase
MTPTEIGISAGSFRRQTIEGRWPAGCETNNLRWGSVDGHRHLHVRGPVCSSSKRLGAYGATTRNHISQNIIKKPNIIKKENPMRIRNVVAALVGAAILAGSGTAVAASAQSPTPPAATPASAHAPAWSSGPKPTIVLVHGAFADSSSWGQEIGVLQRAGFPVIAVANPLRDVASDTAYLESVLQTIQGPIVLVGHSYAGMLIGQAAAEDPNVKALVYVAAYIPVAGESAADLTYMNPGSELTGSNLIERPEPTGTDVYINPATFAQVYAGGLSPSQAAVAAAEQDPIQASALSDPETVNAPASVPKWEIVALHDNAIPTQTEFWMAQRANATVVTAESGHDVPAAQPWVVDQTIFEAAHTVG